MKNLLEEAEREFLAASVAVWKRIDWLTEHGGYHGLDDSTELRIIERRAWERYRDLLNEATS